MQIKVVGRRVQLLRYAGYDGTRSRTEMIGSMSADATSIPRDLVPVLTDAERVQLGDWLDARAAHHEARWRWAALVTLPDTLIRARDGLAEDGQEIDADRAAALWAGMAALQRALRAAGHPRPKRGRATTPLPDPDQPSLEDA